MRAVWCCLLLAACAGDPDCVDPCFQSPIEGEQGKLWTLVNYVDLDPGPGLRDYRGGEITYDGHRGVDLTLANFRAMDRAVDIFAAAPGVVTRVEDGHFDRNTACVSNDWNVVMIRHPSGILSIYGHMRTGSIVVSEGQEVEAGQRLGLVGSSGCSTAAHLHFEVIASDGLTVLDPFRDRMWRDPPVYDPPLTLMDVVVKDGSLAGFDEVDDPPPNADLLSSGIAGLGATVGGGLAGDRLRFVLRRPDGSIGNVSEETLDRVARRILWFENWEVLMPGRWTLEVELAGAPAGTFELDVVVPVVSAWAR